MPTLKDLAQRLHAELDIADVIGRHVALHRKGATLVGLCPFHDDHRPSLTVNPDKGLYHCFVCKAGGDMITFVQKIEGLDFVGALELLAQWAGIPFEDYRGAPPEAAKGQRSREETLREVCVTARELYRRALAHPQMGAKAAAYLTQRGITPEVAERFELGYAPAEWDALFKRLTSKGFRPQTMVEAGLTIHHAERDSDYDRFRDRLIFPIWDALGRPVAFGGRVLESTDDDSPKYINSPETPIYKKGNTLYGYHLAKEPMRAEGRAVLCEGYMDTIAVQVAGVADAVASLGTALTDAQAKLLRRHAERVVMLYDADAAGKDATLRGCEVLIRQGLKVFIAALPEGMDPDDFVQEHGAEALGKLLEEARPALRHLSEWLLNSPKAPEDPMDRRIWALSQLQPCLVANPNVILRDAEISGASEWLGLPEDLVRRHLGESSSPARHDLRQEVQLRKLDRVDPLDQAVVRCLLENADLCALVRAQHQALEGLTDPRARRWIERLLAEEIPQEAGGRFALHAIEVMAAEDATEAETLREILLAVEDYSDPEKILRLSLERLAQRAAQRRGQAIRKTLEDTPASEVPEASRVIECHEKNLQAKQKPKSIPYKKAP